MQHYCIYACVYVLFAEILDLYVSDDRSEDSEDCAEDSDDRKMDYCIVFR